MVTESTADRVLVIACGALAHDLVRVKNLNGWAHLDIQCLPAELHNTPQLNHAESARKNRAEPRTNTDTFSPLIQTAEPAACWIKCCTEEGVERLPGAHCYEMFAGGKTFAALIGSGSRNVLLNRFSRQTFPTRVIVKGLGMDRFPQLKSDYFAHYNKLVFLAQRDDKTADQAAREAAEFLGLEYQRVFTGDKHLTVAMSSVQ